jgi:signal peptidase II
MVSKNLSLSQSFPVVRNIFHITLVHNSGAAFGILKNQTLLFILTSLAAFILIVQAFRNSKAKRFGLYYLSLSLVLAGGIGNLIDRLRFGYVIDFLDLRIWPVFNVADSAITIGAILLGYLLLFKSGCE